MKSVTDTFPDRHSLGGTVIELPSNDSTGIVALLGSFLKPHVEWGIEKRRQRFEFRRARIARWCEWASKLADDSSEIHESPVHAELRPHLRHQTRQMIEGGPIIVIINRGGSPILNGTLEDVNRLEGRRGLSKSVRAHRIGEALDLARRSHLRLRRRLRGKKPKAPGKLAAQLPRTGRSPTHRLTPGTLLLLVLAAAKQWQNVSGEAAGQLCT